MSNLTVFQFQDQDVRFVGTAETPEWVAADIITILYPEADKRNRANYLDKVSAKWKGHTKVMTPGGMQTVTTLYESGLYILIVRSNSPLAIPFQEWLFETVLPSIRQTGKYSVHQEPEHKSEFILACEQLKESQKVLGLSDDDPTYRKLVDGLLFKQFGIEAIKTPTVVIKSKPSVNYTPINYTPIKVDVKTFNVKAECFVVVVTTLIKVHQQKLNGDLPMTVGLMTRYSRPLKNINKIYPDDIKNAMQILYEAGHLRELGINCRGAMNYKVVKLPTSDDIKRLTPA